MTSYCVMCILISFPFTADSKGASRIRVWKSRSNAQPSFVLEGAATQKKYGPAGSGIAGQDLVMQLLYTTCRTLDPSISQQHQHQRVAVISLKFT